MHTTSREVMCLVGALSRSVIEWSANRLLVRGWVHDSSKLEEPEKAAFDASGNEGCRSEATQEFFCKYDLYSSAG
jgi:hypothetical protein